MFLGLTVDQGFLVQSAAPNLVLCCLDYEMYPSSGGIINVLHGRALLILVPVYSISKICQNPWMAFVSSF